MPIEIRELSISTRVTNPPTQQPGLSPKEWHHLKKQLMQECLKMLKTSANKSGFDR
jgi:hypothetical protein